MGVPAMRADGKAAIDRMKAMPVADDCYQGSIRQDGRGLFASHLFQVKAPGESKGPWDYYKLVATTPASEAWKPLAEGGCPFIRA